MRPRENKSVIDRSNAAPGRRLSAAFCKDKRRKVATAKHELRKITAARALMRKDFGNKSALNQ
jgi:hypothetical protein